MARTNAQTSSDEDARPSANDNAMVRRRDTYSPSRRSSNFNYASGHSVTNIFTRPSASAATLASSRGGQSRGYHDNRQHESRDRYSSDRQYSSYSGPVMRNQDYPPRNHDDRSWRNTDGYYESSNSYESSNRERNHREQTNERRKGKVKKIIKERGFGFIQCRNTREDVFFHFSALPHGEVDVDDEVSFTITTDRRTGRDAASDIEIYRKYNHPAEYSYSYQHSREDSYNNNKQNQNDGPIKLHERGPHNEPASVQNELYERSPHVPQRSEPSVNEKLKQELEREELETKLTLKKLENEKMKQELIALQAKNVAASSTGGAAASLESSKLDDDDNASQIPAKRKSPSKESKSASRTKKKANRRTAGQAQLSASTKRALREAQKANDEKMKFQLLKAYEEDLANRKSKKFHHYTEKDLMSSYTPKIVDHCLMEGGVGKFLVQYKKKGSKSNNDASDYCSWTSHEDFLFPVLACKYLKQKMNESICANEIEGLKLWIEDCEERERCLNCLNTFDAEDDEFESHSEIDFCCYLCTCPWSHPLKHVIRNCEYGLTFHRGCCHGYQDRETFETSFMSPVGKALFQQMDDGGNGVNSNEQSSDNVMSTAAAPPLVENNIAEKLQGKSPEPIIVDGDSAKYLNSSMLKCKRNAAVVCIGDCVGNVAVAMKGLGISMKTLIHVEADRVAKHVIRSLHDFSYGETQNNDEVDHIVGLYESLAEIKENPKQLVQKYGPIDMIICSAPKGKSKEESASYASNFFELITAVSRANLEVHKFARMFYLFEIQSDVKDHLPLNGLSTCVCEPNMYVCNWPISSEKTSLLGDEGMPQDSVLQTVASLYESLMKAFTLGQMNKFWRDLPVHIWPFLSMGPSGYCIKLKDGEFGLDAFWLHLQNPLDKLLSDVEYSKHLVMQSPSTRMLLVLLSPMKKVFNEKDYGILYNSLAAQQGNQSEEVTDGTAMNEHGGSSPSNSGKVAASNVVVKAEVKEEELSTDDEENLFDEVEESVLH